MNESMDVSAVSDGGRVAPIAPESGGAETSETGKRLTSAARRGESEAARPGPPGFSSPDREFGAFVDESDAYTPARAWGADSEHPSAQVTSAIEEIAHRVVDSVDDGPAPAFRGFAGGPPENANRSEFPGAATAE